MVVDAERCALKHSCKQLYSKFMLPSSEPLHRVSLSKANAEEESITA
jgi:hypothetical protein